MNLPRHQLDVWLQYSRPSNHAVLSYGYPYSKPHALPEQRVDLVPSELEGSVREQVELLIDSLAARIATPAAVRLPSAEVAPTLTLGYLSLAIQDQRRAAALPAVQLYWYEEVAALETRREREIRLERADLTEGELSWASSAGRFFKKMAWADYSSRVGAHFIPGRLPTET